MYASGIEVRFELISELVLCLNNMSVSIFLADLNVQIQFNII